VARHRKYGHTRGIILQSVELDPGHELQDADLEVELLPFVHRLDGGQHRHHKRQIAVQLAQRVCGRLARKMVEQVGVLLQIR